MQASYKAGLWTALLPRNHKNASSKTVWMAVLEEKDQMLLFTPR
jgi:hypothetical protein